MALHDENVVWHAHPVTPQQREQRHGHRGVVLWFTGLSGSGKSTVAGALEEALHKLGVSTYLWMAITCVTACAAILDLVMPIVRRIFAGLVKWLT
jgi:Mrp family chromosome partitioning ATPase